MKKILGVITLLAIIALPVFGQEKEQSRVASAGQVMKEVLQHSRRYPAECHRQRRLRRRSAFVLKLAFGFGGSYGRGVMTCRGGEDFKGPWALRP